MVGTFRTAAGPGPLGALRRCLSLATLSAATCLSAGLPATSYAQTEISTSSSLSEEIQSKLKQRGTLILRDATLIETLFAIKENWEINIVVDNDVKGAINGSYTNAPLHEILDSILMPHGYGYRAVGDSLVVLKLSDIGSWKPLFATQTLPLQHVPPEEVLKVIEFLLSPNGKAHAVPASKSLVVMDFPDRIALIKERLQELDAAAARVEAGVSTTHSETFSPVRMAPAPQDVVQQSLPTPGSRAAGQNPSDSPAVTTGATEDAEAASEPPVPAADPPQRIGAPEAAQSARRVDVTAQAAPADSSQGPVLDVAFFTPQYVRAPAISDALSKMVSEYGQISVVAEENRIVAIDQPEYLTRIAAAVQRLDVPRSQVRIAALIFDCGLEDADRLGINWSHSVKGTNLTAEGVPQESLSLNTLTLTPPSPTAVNGALTISSLGKHFDVTSAVHALRTSSHSKLLADPTVTVLDQESAKISIVTEIPYQQLTESALGGSIGTTAFREAGVTLEVTPRIARDGTINLIVTPQFSALTGFTETDNQPIIARREATTTVRVANGQTLVLGGLRQKSMVRDRSGVPYLSELKFIGGLFRYRSDSERESELLVFITPMIITPHTFGTQREQRAFEGSKCELGTVDECIDCCPQCSSEDGTIYDNDDFGYGALNLDLPAAAPQVDPETTPAPGPADSPPDAEPHVTMMRAAASSGRSQVRASVTNSSVGTQIPANGSTRRAAQQEGTIVKAPRIAPHSPPATVRKVVAPPAVSGPVIDLTEPPPAAPAAAPAGRVARAAPDNLHGGLINPATMPAPRAAPSAVPAAPPPPAPLPPAPLPPPLPATINARPVATNVPSAGSIAPPSPVNAPPAAIKAPPAAVKTPPSIAKAPSPARMSSAAPKSRPAKPTRSERTAQPGSPLQPLKDLLRL